MNVLPTEMRKLLVLAFAALVSACTVYDYVEPSYSYEPPPANAVYMAPGLWYIDVVIGHRVERRYYRYNGPSRGYMYYRHLGGVHHHR